MLLAVKNVIGSEVVPVDFLDGDFPLIDVLVCKCTLVVKSFYIVVIYIPPYVTIEVFDMFFERFEQIAIFHNSDVILVGDLNVPRFVDKDFSDRKTCVVYECMNVLDLSQCNGVVNHNGRLLDLVLANMSCEVSRDCAPLVPEDLHHPALIVDFQCVCDRSREFKADIVENMYNFRKADFPALYDAFANADWSFLGGVVDVNLATQMFYEFLYGIFNVHVPIKRRFSHTYPSWYTPGIIKNIKLKAKFLGEYKKTGSQRCLNEFKRIRRLVKQEIRGAYCVYLESVQSAISSDPQHFWGFVKLKNGTHGIPGVVRGNGEVFGGPQSIVDSFADIFRSAFIVSDPEFTADGGAVFDDKIGMALSSP